MLLFTSGAKRGMTTVTGMFSSRPWYANPNAWLPADAAMTPRCFWPSSRSRRALRAPRSLNEPVRWRFSSLQKSRIPVTSESGIDSGQGDT